MKDITGEALMRLNELKNLDPMLTELIETLNRKMEIDKCVKETNEKIQNLLSRIDSTVLTSASNRMLFEENTLP